MSTQEIIHHPLMPGKFSLLMFALTGAFQWAAHMTHEQFNMWCATGLTVCGLISYMHRFYKFISRRYPAKKK